MKIEIIRKRISKDKIKELAEASFGSMFKIAVDIERKILAAGGEFHADGEQALIEDGSKQENIWGANFYPQQKSHNRIEYSALINIRPKANNKSMNIENAAVRHKIKSIIESLLLEEDNELS